MIEGWHEGFKTISFTHLLQQEAGLGLEDAKHIPDDVLDGQQVRVTIPTHRRDSFIDEPKAFGIRDTQVG